MKSLVLAIGLATCSLACTASARSDVLEEDAFDGQSFPWYDTREGQVRSMLPPSEQPLPQPSNWVWSNTDRNSQRSSGSQAFWESLWRIVQYVVWLLLAVLLGVVLFHWLQSFRAKRWAEDRADAPMDARRDQDVIEQLPFPVKPTTTHFLTEARRLYQQQKYSEAIIYLFSYQLMQLDRHHQIVLVKGKTNRQYMRELQKRPRLQQIVTQTMLVFEDVFFGHYELDRQRFESCWQRMEEFESQVSIDGLVSTSVQ